MLLTSTSLRQAYPLSKADRESFPPSSSTLLGQISIRRWWDRAVAGYIVDQTSLGPLVSEGYL